MSYETRQVDHIHLPFYESKHGRCSLRYKMSSSSHLIHDVWLFIVRMYIDLYFLFPFTGLLSTDWLVYLLIVFFVVVVHCHLFVFAAPSYRRVASWTLLTHFLWILLQPHEVFKYKKEWNMWEVLNLWHLIGERSSAGSDLVGFSCLSSVKNRNWPMFRSNVLSEKCGTFRFLPHSSEELLVFPASFLDTDMAPQSGLSDCSGPVKCQLWLVNLETHSPDQGRGKKKN